HDLSTIDSKLLDNLNSLEINQICLSYHGVYCYSINVNIIVRASPLVGLVVNGIQNRESVKDISRLLSSSSCLTTRTLHEHAQHKYIHGYFDWSLVNFKFNPHLATSWNLEFDLWRESPARSIQLSPNLSQQIEFLLPIKINDFISA
ncbi:hypothetical protein MJO29_015680, partial [Puccinia striiformis f. sp. tritici]